jgi:hypothetical protein
MSFIQPVNYLFFRINNKWADSHTIIIHMDGVHDESKRAEYENHTREEVGFAFGLMKFYY